MRGPLGGVATPHPSPTAHPACLPRTIAREEEVPAPEAQGTCCQDRAQAHGAAAPDRAPSHPEGTSTTYPITDYPMGRPHEQSEGGRGRRNRLSLLRVPSCECQHNAKTRLGRGFTLQELKVRETRVPGRDGGEGGLLLTLVGACAASQEAGISKKYARSVGIAVDHRRTNLSVRRCHLIGGGRGEETRGVEL